MLENAAGASVGLHVGGGGDGGDRRVSVSPQTLRAQRPGDGVQRNSSVSVRGRPADVHGERYDAAPSGQSQGGNARQKPSMAKKFTFICNLSLISIVMGVL